MMGAFGWPPWLGRPDYATWFGLGLQVDRIEMRRAVNVTLGMIAAQMRGSLDRSWYDALCQFEEDVDETMDRANAQRELANFSRRGRR